MWGVFEFARQVQGGRGGLIRAYTLSSYGSPRSSSSRARHRTTLVGFSTRIPSLVPDNLGLCREGIRVKKPMRVALYLAGELVDTPHGGGWHQYEGHPRFVRRVRD